MQKFKVLKHMTALSVALSAGVASAASFDDAIKNATTTGQFRLGYINVTPDVAGEKNTSATAFGGQIKFETAKWNRLQFAIAPYFSEKLAMLSGNKANNELNTGFLDTNGNSYAYLGEAYVNYAFNNGSLRLGRQQIDSPFINTDDIRMLPNTFNAVWLNAALTDNLSIAAGVVNEWAGFDSGDSQNQFKKASNDGVTALGASYKMKAHHAFQGWYYDFNGKYSQYYLDAAYKNGAFHAGLQYSKYNEVKNSGTAGNVWGVKVGYDIGPVSLAVAVNQGKNGAGKSASLGLGGGSYFASMEEMTIHELQDAMAQVVSLSYAVTDKLSLGFASGHFEDKGKANANTNETDIVITYTISDQLDIGFAHVTVDNKAAPADAATNFSRNLARVSYNF